MNTPWSGHDDDLLRALGSALRNPDPTPPEVYEAARFVFTWRTVDAELAALTNDSARELAVPALRAGEDGAGLRRLTFETPELTIELGVSREVLLGQLVPPGPAELTLRAPDGSSAGMLADELGCFRVAPPPTGLFTLSCTTPDGRTTVTPAIRL